MLMLKLPSDRQVGVVCGHARLGSPLWRVFGCRSRGQRLLVGRPRPTCEVAAVPHCNVHVCLDSIEPTATLEYRSGEGESLVGWEQASRGNNSHYGVISSVFQYLLRLVKAGPSARL